MRILSLIFLTLLSSSLSHAAPYSISNSHSHTLDSGQHQYDIYVRLPNSYQESERPYPIVLVNDSEWAFPIAAGVSSLLMVKDMQEVILVGISYSHGDAPGTSRTRDYTPTFAPDETSFHSVEAKQVSGQAAQYLGFIESKVFPFLNKHYRVDLNNKTFVGHSFGGLLGSYALVTQPELFEHYIIGSPSLWYDDKVMFSLEEKWAAQSATMPANVLMYVGDAEDGNVHTMIQDLNQFVTQMRSRNYEGLSLQTQVINSATHHSAFSHLLTLALPKIHPKDKK